jgi:type IV pilus assembly protein PilW
MTHIAPIRLPVRVCARTSERTSASALTKAHRTGWQAGVSLVELLVATAIGAIISMGAATLFANTILNTRTLNSASQIQEVGMQTISTLSRQLRQTGFVDLLATNNGLDLLRQDTNAAMFNIEPSATSTLFQTTYNQAALHGCDGAYSATTLADSTCGTASSTAQSLTVAYQVLTTTPSDGGAPTLLDGFTNRRGMAGDCNNNSTRMASPPVDYAVNRYSISANNVLSCRGNGGTSQPIANNIEQLVVLYGLAQTNNNLALIAPSQDLSVSQYVPAAAITAANAWSRVIAVRLCILVAGEAGSLAANSAALVTNKRDCTGTAFVSTAQNRLRQTFTQTVTLRNQVRTGNTSN